MKKLVLSLTILIAFAFSGMAQPTGNVSSREDKGSTPYYPLVQEGENRQQWNVVYMNSMTYPNDYFTDVQYIQDDITLVDVVYRLVWVTGKRETRIAGAVREEDKRVYFRRYVGQSYQDETILYDFNLTVGDTVVAGWNEEHLIVLEESETEVDGTTRRQLGLGINYGNGHTSGIEEYWIEGVGSTYGFLNSGYENWVGTFVHLLCYHEDDNLMWMNESFSSCVMNSEEENLLFAPQGAEWYFNLSPFMFTGPTTYYRMAVEGDTVIQGHVCSVITRQFLGGNGDEQYVYQNHGVVYWYNQTMQAFTTLYDFNAEAGESWICYIDSCPFQVTVQSVEEIVWEGHTYRVQHVNYDGDGELYYFGTGQIIEGIGDIYGLFPYPDACYGVVYDGSYPDYLRCYLVDGELLYHYGSYDCDQQAYCWDGTVADAYAGGDGTSENPYQIATSNQLALLAQQTNDGTGGDAWYELTANINLQRCDGGSQQWISIGTETNMFRGHFNGNENYIINLNQYAADGAMQNVFGLFGYTDRAEISNVQLVQCSIGGRALHVGGLVGYAGLTDISNCSITQSSVKTENGVAGGLVGSADMPYGMGAYITDIEPYHIINCHVGVATWIEGASGAGGIVGAVNRLDGRNPCVITDCTVENDGYPELFTVISQLNAGGIVGWFHNGTITRCLNQFDITGGLKFGVGGIAGEVNTVFIDNCTNDGKVFGEYASGGIVGLSNADEGDYLEVLNCTNTGRVQVHNTSTSGAFVGGVVGSCWNSAIMGCVNKGDITMGIEYRAAAGGIVGYSEGLLANCYNRGTVLAVLGASVQQIEELFVGGIVGRHGTRIYNVYNTGVIDVPDLPEVIQHGYGNIFGEGNPENDYLNAYWLEDDDFSACGMADDLASHASSAFVPGATPTSWILNDSQYGTDDLLDALNSGASFVFAVETVFPYLYVWEEDTENINDGLPVLGAVESLVGTKFLDQETDLYFIITSHNTVELTHCEPFEAPYYQGDLVIPETVFYGNRFYTVTRIGDEAFRDCVKLVSVAIPNSVNELGSAAFDGCEKLTTVTLPQDLTSIPEYLFNSCTHLDGIVIPESVTSIGNEAFLACVSLEEITIPDQVKSIGMAAFKSCRNLNKVELGNNIAYLDEQAFRTESDSTKMTVICHGTTPAQCGDAVFPETSLQKTVIVPCGCEEAYRTAWGDYWQSGNFDEDCDTEGTEWYYEILNDDGSITFQYLMHESDTTINDEEHIHVIVRINTLYDKGNRMEKSREYIYENEGKVYWWNKTLGEFTVLYDYGAEEGDEWEINVGTASVVMHVDAVEQYEYEGRLFKMLQVSDAENLFGGIIVCGIGHLTSFFPEKLMHSDKGYRVEGIRCFWQGGELVFKYGEKDCDEVYKQYHNGVEEHNMAGFRVYPNPTDGVIVVETFHETSLPSEYHIANLLGQTLMTGWLNAESQQIDVSALPAGVYFLTVDQTTKKLIIR